MDNNLTQELNTIAILLFGYEVVHEVIRLVNIIGVEDIIDLFIDRELELYFDCLEFLYLL